MTSTDSSTTSTLRSLKEKISKVREKCKWYESQLKKVNKIIKVKKLDSSSRQARHKKKLEKKYLEYKKRLTGLMSRQSMLLNKNPNLNQIDDEDDDEDDEDDEEVDEDEEEEEEEDIDEDEDERRRRKRKQKGSSLERRSSKREDRAARKRRHRERSSTVESKSKQQKAAAAAAVKLPYPVLNDKRDKAQILTILKEKQANLNDMLDQTESTLDQLDADGAEETGDGEEVETKRVRLRNLHESIKIQLTRLERQIDYIKVNLEMRRVNKQLGELDEEDEADVDEAAKLRRRLAELEKKNENLTTLMKDANRRSLQQQQQQQSQGSDADISGRRIDNEGKELRFLLPL